MGNIVGGSSGSNMVNPIAHQFIKDSIAKHKVVIFSKSYCPYCTMAKEQFRKLNHDFLAIEIENRPDCDDLQEVFQVMTKAKSVPRVFVNGNFIGGGTDVKKLYENGKLAEMLK